MDKPREIFQTESFSPPEVMTKAVNLTGDIDIDLMLNRCITTFQTKGKEYTVGSPDRLANFRGVAADVGIPMEKAWYVFFNKHLRAVQSYIKNGCKVSSEEGIDGRIMDCVVYLLLFYKMTVEIERSRELKRYADDALNTVLNGVCAPSLIGGPEDFGGSDF